MIKRILISALCLLLSFASFAQETKTSISVNAGDALVLGTIGVGASQAVHRHWTVDLQGRWNPWTYGAATDKQFQMRHQTYAGGAKWWPWHVFSGWYVQGMAQYQEYSRGGLFGSSTEEGDAFGMSFGFGYMHMLSPHWNFSAGVSGWAGYTKYDTYACPRCGHRTGKGEKAFILPNEIVLGFSYVF